MNMYKDDSVIAADIKGYEGIYKILSNGSILSLSRKRKGKSGSIVQHHERINNGCKDADGYMIAKLRKDGVNKMVKIHKLLAEAFIPNPENKPQVNHINGVRDDNRLENLEWVTISENIKHSFRVLGKKTNAIGTVVKAEKNSDVKIFNSFSEAERVLGIFRATIRLSIKKNIPVSGWDFQILGTKPVRVKNLSSVTKQNATSTAADNKE